MDVLHREKNKKTNPIQNANILSRLTFMYMIPVFKKGYRKDFVEEDLFAPLEEHKSKFLGDQLEKVWKEESKKYKKFSLHVALFKIFGCKYLLIGLIKLFIEVMLVIALPICVGKILAYFRNDQSQISEKEVYAYTALLIAVFFIDQFLTHSHMIALLHLSMKLRVACISMIYRKTLHLTKAALSKTTVGQIVNLLSNDVSKFETGFIIAHSVWISPIQTIVGAYILYTEIGVAAFFGIGFLIIFIPLQIWLGKAASTLRLKTALRTDERVRLMNEIINGIQVIKMYTWEKPFANVISWARKKEIDAIKVHFYYLSLILSFGMFVTRTAVFISILSYVLLGEVLTAETAFFVTAVYSQIKVLITLMFSKGIMVTAEANVSLLRIHKFLMYEEFPLRKNQNECHRNPQLILENVSAKWIEESTNNTLFDINLKVDRNLLLAIIGPVGSGKTSLLNVILKELPLQSGTMEISGKISYSCQEPWIFMSSIRQNILFGEDFDEDRYKMVIKTCALESDFSMFPHGDHTIIGEKGKTLSGGQKARVNLARCVYKKADIYLLDDPLSAVDANVGKQLYEECIKKFLSDKICILITHQLQYLKNADKIIVMKDGRIEIEGKYDELQKSGVDFTKLLEDYNEERDNGSEYESFTENSQISLNDTEEEIQKEYLASGGIDPSIYKKYLKAGGNNFMIVVLILSFIFSQLFLNGGDYFLSYWVNLEESLGEKDSGDLNQTNILERDKIMYIFSGITLGAIFFALFHTVFFFIFFMLASMNLHNYIFSRIIKAKMAFFNKNPSGRILNRFSKDLGAIDELIPNILFDVLEIALLLIGTLILTCVVNPWLLPPSFLLMLIFYLMRNVYLRTSRRVKRIEAIARSPIFQHMTSSIHGLSTIRAFNKENVLIHEFDRFQDEHSSAWFLYFASHRAFNFWSDIICITFISIVILTLLSFNKGIYSGDMGLIITQYFNLIGTLQFLLNQWSELENQMTSVERLLEYTKLDTENENQTVDEKTIVDWPKNGKIEFRNVCLKYESTELHVLKNLNFVVEPKQKIGIVGRTGAGKSSIITALFRLYENEGNILIDDLDISKLPLNIIRSRISIIPQEPVLFSGTIRKNLDPFNEYEDEVLWNALEQVELKDLIKNFPLGLNTSVTENGSNFSVGQKQLVCLARAIVRKNKILILDEATANIDPHTDVLIQTSLRKNFADYTVLTIAHRLDTVMKSDKIIVMDAGRIREFDSPNILLGYKNGYFKKLVDTTGKFTSTNLKKSALDKFD